VKTITHSVIACLLLTGCQFQTGGTGNTAGPAADVTSPNPSPGGTNSTPGTTGDPNTRQGPATGNQTPPEKPPVVEPEPTRAIAITTDNTTIDFVGTHVGDKPDPRRGKFQRFSGQIDLNTRTGLVSAIQLEIETESLSTDIDRLTAHLKSPDFFDVNEHPKATFKSTEVKMSEQQLGQFTIVGELTLHGVTKTISIPATILLTGDRLTLTSRFKLDRTEFGMNFGPDQVEKDVMLFVRIDG
jgi:polyisoprenoid-binding protein YceI